MKLLIFSLALELWELWREKFVWRQPDERALPCRRSAEAKSGGRRSVRMLDLFCGRFGWSRAFAARGWECVGVDLVEPAEIPERCWFVRQDVLEWSWSDVCRAQGGGFDFICASSPCEQFSVHGMKHFHPNPPYPELGIKLFNHTRALCEESGVPYVMENVRAASSSSVKLCITAGRSTCGELDAANYAAGNPQRVEYGRR